MRRTASLALLAIAVVVTLAQARTHHATVVLAPPTAPRVDDAARARTFSFDSSVSPGDRQWFLASVARARPEAQALVAQVDGLVTVSTAGRSATTLVDGADMMGETRPGPDGFTVWLNAAQLDGDRAIDRPTVVLHELGHVIDIALLSDDLRRKLDAGIPRVGACENDGVARGSCAAPQERFADTFAKWALGGAVSDVGSGYGIPLPPSLETWGEPLGALALGQQG
jgi:hypothetical protein